MNRFVGGLILVGILYQLELFYSPIYNIFYRYNTVVYKLLVQ